MCSLCIIFWAILCSVFAMKHWRAMKWNGIELYPFSSIEEPLNLMHHKNEKKKKNEKKRYYPCVSKWIFCSLLVLRGWLDGLYGMLFFNRYARCSMHILTLKHFKWSGWKEWCTHIVDCLRITETIIKSRTGNESSYANINSTIIYRRKIEEKKKNHRKYNNKIKKGDRVKELKSKIHINWHKFSAR